MSKKETTPDLFDFQGNEVTPEAPKKPVKIPTEQEVAALVRQTGESTRKCYFWLLAEKNKEA